MIIRPYHSSDKLQVRDLVNKILGKIFISEPGQEEFFLKEFENNKGYEAFFVTEIEDPNETKIVGTAGLKTFSKDKVRLKRLYIDENYQGRGIAQRLLDQCIGFARAKGYKKIIFQSYPIMKKVQSFLRKNGFTESDGPDPEMIYFEKQLKE